MKRRRFIQRGLIGSGALALTGANAAGESRANASGVSGYEYRLPDFKTGSRLLFQGDSITDMKWGRNQEDRNHYLGHSYVFLIAARLGVEMADAKLDFYNRGVSGNKVSNLRQRWEKDAIEIKPDLLSVLVGINDVSNGVSDEEYETDYRHILEASRKENPELRVVLLDPFIVQSGKYAKHEKWAPMRAAVDKYRGIVARLAKDHDAVHIQTQDVFDAAAKAHGADQWIWDGVHPLPQGHELIARNWLHKVSERWPST